MKWAVVTSDDHGNHQIQGFKTKHDAEAFVAANDTPAAAEAGLRRWIYRLVPA